MYIYKLYLYLHIHNSKMKKMKNLSEECKKKIMTDNEVSLEIAKMLGIQQLSVKALVTRNSDKLIAYPIVVFFENLGMTIDEILV